MKGFDQSGKGHVGYFPPASSADRRGKGFTLLELLIVSVLMVGVMALTAEMWRYFSVGLVDLNARSKALEELRLAVETISTDMGSAVGATTVGDDRIVFCKDGGEYNGHADWAPPDKLVEYYLADGQLVRYDCSDGSQVTAARVTGFEVENVTETLLRIAIRFDSADVSREITLMWSKP